MTDSDSSLVEVDSKGKAISKAHKLNKKSNSSSHYRSRQSRKSACSSLSYRIDPDSVVFLSSSQAVRDIVQLFDVPKKKMVESIGFGGLLHLPNIPSHDKSFSLWLLRNLKWFTGTLCVGENLSLNLTAEHIGKIIGLNYTGIDVSDKSLESLAEKSSFLESSLSFLRTDTDIVQAAQSFVQSPSPQTISVAYSNNFKVAFVIFVMGRFLAPGENYTEGNFDFWGALEVPEAISCYNWSSYVLSNILESARILNWDMVGARKLSAIGCCTLILQIFYLDNVDFGTFNRQHNVFPRVKHYCNDTITRMIECVRCNENGTSSTPSFGRIQVLRNSNSCYQLSINPVKKTPPCFFTPSPRMHSSSAQSSGKETISSSVHWTRNLNQELSSVDLPLILSKLPSSSSQEMGITAFISENYHGHTRSELLEAIKSHQQRCSDHVKSFTSGLKDAIADENDKFARCIIEHVTRKHEIGLPRPLDARCISYNSTAELTDHGSAGSRYPKIRRMDSTTRLGVLSAPSEEMSGPVDLNAAPTSVPYNWTDKSTPNQFHGYSSVISMNRSTQSAFPISQLDKPSNPFHGTQPIATHDSDNQFVTPESSSKFVSSVQSFSPTTENKIFNGISLSCRQINSMQSIDLNDRSFAAQYTSSPVEKRKCQIGSLARSHWSLALEAPPLPDPSACASLFQWLVSNTRAQELNRPWIMHDSPRFIQIQGSQLRSEFVLSKPMSFQMFDIIIRCLKQLDRSIYLATHPFRWRHIFESDFSLHAIGDDQPSENIAVREQFIGPEVDYEICRCSIFFVPVLSDDVWWCYAFEMKSKTIFIMDPANANENDDTLIKRHVGTIQLIKDNLSNTVNTLFSGWKPHFRECKPKVFRSKFMPCSRYQSSFFTVFFVSNFDGISMALEPSPLSMQKFKQTMLQEVLSMYGNNVVPPTAYVHVVD